MDLDFNKMHWNWTEFCGSDVFQIWVKNQYDLSACFQVTCLRIPILSLIAIISAYYSGTQFGWIYRSHGEQVIIQCRLVITALLAYLPITQIAILITYFPKSLYTYNYLLAVLEPLTWLLHFSYLLCLRNKLGPSLRGPVILGSLWTLFYGISIVHARSLYLDCESFSSNMMLKINAIFAAITVILQTFYGITMIPSERISIALPQQPDERQLFHRDESETNLLSQYQSFHGNLDSHNLGTGFEDVGWFSKLFFLWVNPLMISGINGQIKTTDDLFDLPEYLSSPALYRKLNRSLMNQQNKMNTPCTESDNHRKVSILKALHSSFGVEFYCVGILKFLADVLGFAAPLLLNQLLQFIENKTDSVLYGYIFAGGIFLASFLGSFFMVHFNFQIGIIGLKLRGSLIAKIYHKLFYLPANVISKSVGEVVNYISTDINRIVNSCQSFHAVWSIPFQIVVTLYLLYTQVGIACIAGVLFSVILIPINKVVADKIGSLSIDLMREKDDRVQVMTEVIKGIRTIKLHVWEEYFVSKVLGIRVNEIKYLKYRKYLDAICVYFWATTPVIISISTFATYVLLGGKLNAAIVFTSIALLNMLISPLNAFPWVLNGLIEAWVSVNRVQKLFELDDMNYNEYFTEPLEVEDIRNYYDKELTSFRPITSPSDEPIIYMKNGNFNWKAEYFNLSDVTITIPKGQLLGVYGPVGSGKSSFLSSLIAEIYKVSGIVSVNRIDRGIGYVSQTPWVQQTTVRENILFGKPYSPARYKTIIEVCALAEDMRSWTNGDMEVVGEGGCTLSGGQKARITLARAVYQDKDIYLIDDVLSAVDPEVAYHIFQKCIRGLLRDKTCVFVSQQKLFLSLANSLIVFEDGSIVKQGDPKVILKCSPKKEDIEFVAEDDSNPDYSFIKDTSIHTSQIEEEISAVGTVALKVYLSYWNAVGPILAALILISILLMQITRNGTDWWLSVWVSGQSYDYIKNTFYENDTYFFLLIYGLIGCANSAVTIVRSFLFAYGGLRAAVSIHRKLLDSIIKAQIVFFDKSPLGRIINRFSSDTFTVDDSLPFALNNLLAQFFSVLGTIVMTLYGLPWLFLFLTPLVPFYHWLQNRYRLTSRQLKRLSSVTLSPLYTHFTETVAGLATIRAFRDTSRFRQDNHIKLESSQKCQFSSSAASLWLNIRLQLIGLAIIGGVCLISILQHQFDVAYSGMVGLAISYALSLTSKLGGVISVFTETEQEMIAMERIREYIDIESKESIEGKIFDIAVPFFWPSQGIIEFRNVYCQYRNDCQPVLRNVSFQTMEGEKIAIVGRTGAGKSTLFLCLFRLVEITRGSIVLDNIDISRLSLKTLRSKLAIIPQDPFLFAGTVRENLDPLNKYEDEKIWDAIARCHLARVVRNLGLEGLNGVMESGGANLSSGERQLFCLARAVLRNAKVICIDEATSNIDEKTDKLLQETIRTCFKHSTVFAITHKINTIIDYDRVIVMGHGDLLESDSPQNLLKNPDSYLYEFAQQVSEK